MADKVKHIARDEVDRVAAITRDAAVSRAYLYPIKGVAYYMSHRSLWQPMLSRLGPTLGVGLGVVSSMFFFTYLPQVAMLAFVEGPMAPISAIPLVLSESSTLFNVISRTFLIEDALIDTFDGTLVARDLSPLVAEGRQLKTGQDPIGKLGKMIKKPFARFTPTAIVRYLMYLPLNLIPVVGTLLFIIAQGRRNGPSAHASFGVIANLLELIPIAGIFFAFTNQVAAALWAADIEKRQHTNTQGEVSAVNSD
ncbi:MAG: hypothetical protein Q9162_003863 [Coniocarpon cinnabarinum]